MGLRLRAGGDLAGKTVEFTSSLPPNPDVRIRILPERWQGEWFLAPLLASASHREKTAQRGKARGAFFAFLCPPHSTGFSASLLQPAWSLP